MEQESKSPQPEVKNGVEIEIVDHINLERRTIEVTPENIDSLLDVNMTRGRYMYDIVRQSDKLKELGIDNKTLLEKVLKFGGADGLDWVLRDFNGFFLDIPREEMFDMIMQVVPDSYWRYALSSSSSVVGHFNLGDAPMLRFMETLPDKLKSEIIYRVIESGAYVKHLFYNNAEKYTDYWKLYSILCGKGRRAEALDMAERFGISDVEVVKKFIDDGHPEWIGSLLSESYYLPDRVAKILAELPEDYKLKLLPEVDRAKQKLEEERRAREERERWESKEWDAKLRKEMEDRIGRGGL